MGEGPVIAQGFVRYGIGFSVIQDNRFTHSGGDDGARNGLDIDVTSCRRQGCRGLITGSAAARDKNSKHCYK